MTKKGLIGAPLGLKQAIRAEKATRTFILAARTPPTKFQKARESAVLLFGGRLFSYTVRCMCLYGEASAKVSEWCVIIEAGPPLACGNLACQAASYTLLAS